MVFPPPRLFWLAYLHLRNKKTRGVGVFALWYSLPTTVKFVYQNYLPRSVVCFRKIETNINCHTNSMYEYFKKNSVIIFEFDLDSKNPFQTNYSSTHCVLAGCPFCFN